MKHLVLLPTYNESQNIEKIISRIFSKYQDIYIKVIDDNSPDGTAQIVESLLNKYPNLSILKRKGKEGLGKAYIAGFKEVMLNPEITHVFMMDADMSHDPEYIEEMINQSKKFDLVIGSRYTKGGSTEGWETWRKLLSYFGNLYARTITRMPINDVTGGFNCINLSALKRIDLDTFSLTGYAFIMELKFNLFKKGVTITEVPITFYNRYGGESKISNNIINEGIIAPWKMILKK
jgi:dolichol-phosphate mannosyltransferase